jgi:hypothetical protein
VSTYSELLFAALGAAKRMIPVFCMRGKSYSRYIELGKMSHDAKFAVLGVAALLLIIVISVHVGRCNNITARKRKSNFLEVRQFNN